MELTVMINLINSIIYVICFIIILNYIVKSWGHIKNTVNKISEDDGEGNKNNKTKEKFGNGGLRGLASTNYQFYDLDSVSLGDVSIVKNDTLFPINNIYDKTLLEQHSRAKMYKIIENNMLLIGSKIYDLIRKYIKDVDIANKIFNKLFPDDTQPNQQNLPNKLINEYSNDISKDEMDKFKESEINDYYNTYIYLNNLRFYNGKLVNKNDEKYIEFEKKLKESNRYKCSMITNRDDIRVIDIDSLYSKQSNIESYDPDSGEIASSKINNSEIKQKIIHSCGITVGDGNVIITKWNNCTE